MPPLPQNTTPGRVIETSVPETKFPGARFRETAAARDIGLTRDEGAA